MSGIEIAGVVLGVLPIVISALQAYGEGVGTIERWWSYERELAAMKRAVQAEQAIFLNTCEKMLTDILDKEELDLLLEDPAGHGWSDDQLSDNLKASLGRSYTPCLVSMGEISNVVQCLRAELQIDEATSNLKKSGQSFKDEQLLRLKLSLSKGSLKKYLQDLEKHNTNLMRLTQQSVELAPARRRRASRPSKALLSARRQATTLYDALASSLSPNCPNGHGFYLELEHRLDGSRIEGSEGSQLKSSFRAKLFVTPSGNSSHLQSILFKPFTIALEPKLNAPISIAGGPEIPSAEKIFAPRKAKVKPEGSSFWSKFWGTKSKAASQKRDAIKDIPTKPKQVKFPVATVSIAEAQRHGPPLQHVNVTERISELCEALKGSRVTNVKRWRDHLHIGYIVAKEPNAVDVYKIDSSGEIATLSSLSSLSSALRSVVDISKGIPPRGMRYRMALILASSIFQLCETPWLPNTWSNDDIAFEGPSFQENGLFFSKHFPDIDYAGVRNNRQAPGIRNIAIFTLGICLIELAFWKPISAFKSSEEMVDGQPHLSLLSDWSTATRLLLDIAQEAGIVYGDVVRRCIHCEFDQRHASFEDDAFQAAFFERVIEPLQTVCSDFSM